MPSRVTKKRASKRQSNPLEDFKFSKCPICSSDLVEYRKTKIEQVSLKGDYPDPLELEEEWDTVAESETSVQCQATGHTMQQMTEFAKKNLPIVDDKGILSMCPICRSEVHARVYQTVDKVALDLDTDLDSDVFALGPTHKGVIRTHYESYCSGNCTNGAFTQAVHEQHAKWQEEQERKAAEKAVDDLRDL